MQQRESKVVIKKEVKGLGRERELFNRTGKRDNQEYEEMKENC